jgi:hypothetical protein
MSIYLFAIIEINLYVVVKEDINELTISRLIFTIQLFSLSTFLYLTILG